MLDLNFPLPDWAETEPVYDEFTDLYLQFFYELSTCRSQGMGVVCPIQWNYIVEHGRMLHLTGPDLDTHVFYIMEMDREFLKFKAEEISDGGSESVSN